MNLQPLRDQILSLARLPFRHARIIYLQGLFICNDLRNSCFGIFYVVSRHCIQ